MKSLKHILGLLMMTAMIIAAGCNKEENGGKKENYPHPTSTYKACPILAHFGNEKLGIKEINYSGDVFVYDKEQKLVKFILDELTDEFEYEYNTKGCLIKVKDNDGIYNICYDAYGFIDSIYYKVDGRISEYECYTFKYSHDTVFMEYEGVPFIMKFSDDLYVIYSASIDGKWWCKYNWQNGNLISWYNNKGEKENYQYDNSLNIYIV